MQDQSTTTGDESPPLQEGDVPEQHPPDEHGPGQGDGETAFAAAFGASTIEIILKLLPEDEQPGGRKLKHAIAINSKFLRYGSLRISEGPLAALLVDVAGLSLEQLLDRFGTFLTELIAAQQAVAKKAPVSKKRQAQQKELPAGTQEQEEGGSTASAASATTQGKKKTSRKPPTPTVQLSGDPVEAVEGAAQLSLF
jgi:hypothetical protein